MDTSNESYIGERNRDCSSILNCLVCGERKAAVANIKILMSEYGDYGLGDELEAIEKDVERMYDYWSKGVKDPSLENVAGDITRRLAEIVSEFTTRSMNTEDSCYMVAMNRTADKKGDSWEWDDVRNKLEAMMSDEAIAGLYMEGNGKEKLYRLIDEHNEYQKRLFYHTACCGLLKRQDANKIKKLLVSPTVDSSDQQVLVSALTLAGSRAFDILKYEIMAYVCRNAADMYVRQRALVGLVLTQGYGMHAIYPEQKAILDDLLADEEIYSQLVELQMQLVFCAKAEEDSRIMSEEIIPNMMKVAPYKITSKGFEEVEEDITDEILGKDSAEMRAEQVEKLYGQLKEMQSAGSDMFFTGFAQTKKGPFFDEMVNWFVPYGSMRKGIREIYEMFGGKSFFDFFLANSSMCDSDKFSFVTVMGSLYDEKTKHLFEKIKKINSGINYEAPDETDPTMYRRNYLQGIYRFFRLFKWTNAYLSPFESSTVDAYLNVLYKPYLVFAINPLFTSTEWYKNEMPRLFMFFSKNMGREIMEQMKYYDVNVVETYEGYMAYVKYLQNMYGCYTDECVDYLKKAVKINPTSLVAKKMLSKAYINSGQSEKALPILEDYCNEENSSPYINYLFALANFETGEFEKPLSILYELEYKYPDNTQVSTLLGILLLLKGEYKRSLRLLEKGDIASDDTEELYAKAYVVAYLIETKSITKTMEFMRKESLKIFNFFTSDRLLCKGLMLQRLKENGFSKTDVEMLIELSKEWS